MTKKDIFSKKAFLGLSALTLSTVVASSLQYIMLPFFTHYLSPSDYTIIRLLLNSVMLLSPLVSLNLLGIVNVEYFKREEKDFVRLLSSVLFIPLLVGVFFSAVCVFVFMLIESPVGVNAFYVVLLPFIAACYYYSESLLTIFLIERKRLSYSFFFILRSLLEVGIAAWLIIGVDWKWEGRIIPFYIIMVLFTAVAFIYFSWKKWIIFQMDRKLMRASLLYGAPLIVYQLSKFIINYSDGYFLNYFIHGNDTGIYLIGYQTGALIVLASNIGINFLTPVIYDCFGKNSENSRTIYFTAFKYFMLVHVVGVGVIILCSPWVFEYLFHHDYANGNQYVWIIAISYLFHAVSLYFALALFYFHKTKTIMRISVTNIIISISLNFFLIRQWGEWGAAVATCISFFILMLQTVLLSWRLIPHAKVTNNIQL